MPVFTGESVAKRMDGVVDGTNDLHADDDATQQRPEHLDDGHRHLHDHNDDVHGHPHRDRG
jgi:hypothetical protein